MKHLILLLAFTLFSGVTQADILEGEQESCKLQLNAEEAALVLERQEAGLYDVPAGRLQADYLVPLAFHIVRTTSGTGGIPQAQLDQAMIDLEDAYAGTGFCFWIALQDTINSSTYYSIDNDAERTALKAINNHPNAIDCYFVDYDGGYCGVSSFTFSADQGITLKNSCVGLASNPSTFPHEVGHYFDLFHTHEPFYGNECPDGSNCGVAGDLVCDTPADPNISGQVNGSCNYTGSATIYCNGANRAYSPDPTNLMSYSTKVCRTNFSAGQRNRMIATLTNLRWGEIGFNAPDFRAPTPTGWTDALVPRDATGATNGNTPVTATLPGNAGNATWLNVSIRQNNANSYFPGVYSRIYLDDVYFWWYSFTGGTWNSQAYYQNFGPITVRGGRHSLHTVIDLNDEICETSEGNNRENSQYIWSPYDLTEDETLLRSAPPAKMTTTYTYPNCDGFQFTTSGWWSGVATMPLNASADFDVRLHNDYTGSTAGFGAPLVTSTWATGQPDWVFVNRNVASYGTYQAGVFNYDGETPDYRISKIDSETVPGPFDGARYCGTLAADAVVGMMEFYLGSDEEWSIELLSDSGVDLDLYFYDQATEYGSHNNYTAFSGNPGTPNEQITYSATEAGWCAVAIARDGFEDMGTEVQYELRMTRLDAALVIEKPVTPVVGLFQDNAPWGSTEWTDQLTAQGISYTVHPTVDLIGLAPYAYDVVIVPSPTGTSSYNNVRAALAELDAFNLSGGVLVLSTCLAGSGGDGDTWLDGISQAWNTCGVANPVHHFLTTGANLAGAPGGSAVHYVYDSTPAGWNSLAWSDCDNLPTFLYNDVRGAIMYGAPMEHGAIHYDCSLGESIENIVAWTMRRANRTVRLNTGSGIAAAGINYINPAAGNITFTNTESSDWLTVTPASDIIYANSIYPVTCAFTYSGQSLGFHHEDVSVAHPLWNSLETVHVYLNYAGPRQPAVPLIVDIHPVDFSPGNAIVHVTALPVTQDVNGNPLMVDYYNLYYDDTAYFETPQVVSLAVVDSELHFHNVGMLDMGFVRITAVDENGVVLADSRPDLPLPDTAAIQRGPASLFGPVPVDVVPGR